MFPWSRALNTRMLRVLFCGLALIGLAACNGRSPRPSAEAEESSRPLGSSDHLHGGWRVHSIGSRELQGDKRPSLVFAEDGRVGGNAGCNRFLAHYQLFSEGQAAVGELMVTRRICPEPIMLLESLLLSRLRTVEQIHASPEGDLLLFTGDDRLPIRLKPDPTITAVH